MIYYIKEENNINISPITIGNIPSLEFTLLSKPNFISINSTSGIISGSIPSEMTDGVIRIEVNIKPRNINYTIDIVVKSENQNNDFYQLLVSESEKVAIDKQYIIDMDIWKSPSNDEMKFKELNGNGENTKIILKYYLHHNFNNSNSLIENIKNKIMKHIHINVNIYGYDGDSKIESKSIFKSIENSYLYDIEMKIEDDIEIIVDNDNNENGLLFNSLTNSILLHVGIISEKSVKININNDNVIYGLISGKLDNDYNKNGEKEISGIFVKVNKYSIESRNKNVKNGLLFGEVKDLRLSYSFIDVNEMSVNVKSGSVSLTIVSGISNSKIEYYRCFTLIGNTVNIESEDELLFSPYLNEGENELLIDESWNELKIGKLSGEIDICGFNCLLNTNNNENMKMLLSNSYINYHFNENPSKAINVYVISKYSNSKSSISNIYISITSKSDVSLSNINGFDFKNDENSSKLDVIENVYIEHSTSISITNSYNDERIKIVNENDSDVKEKPYKYLNGFYTIDSKLYYSKMIKYNGNKLIDEYGIFENVDITFRNDNSIEKPSTINSIWIRNENPYSFIYTIKPYSLYFLSKESQEVTISISSSTSDCISFDSKSIVLTSPLQINYQSNNKIAMNIDKCNNKAYSNHEIEIKGSGNSYTKLLTLEIINDEIKPEYETDLKDNIDLESGFYIQFSLPYPSKVELIKVMNKDKNEESKELIVVNGSCEMKYEMGNYLYKMNLKSGNVSIPTNVEFILNVIFDNNGYKMKEYNYSLSTTIQPICAYSFNYSENNILIKDEQFSISPEYEGYGGVFSIIDQSTKSLLESIGIMFDEKSGIFSGIPNNTLEEIEIEVKMKNYKYEFNTKLKIEVIYPPPNQLKYENESYEIILNEIFEIKPSEWDDKVEAKFSYESNINLEDYNITLNNENGIISGIPTELLNRTEIRIILKNRGGNISFILNLSITYPPLSRISYDKEKIGVLDAYFEYKPNYEHPDPSVKYKMNKEDLNILRDAELTFNESNGIISGFPIIEINKMLKIKITSDNDKEGIEIEISVIINTLPPEVYYENSTMKVYYNVSFIYKPISIVMKQNIYFVSEEDEKILEEYNMKLNNKTGEISGKPMKLTDKTKDVIIRINVNNTVGSNSTILKIVVVYSPPTVLEYPKDNLKIFVDEEFELKPCKVVGEIDIKFRLESKETDIFDKYNITIDENDGTIRGLSHEVIYDPIEISITAYNEEGSISFKMNFTVVYPIPFEFSSEEVSYLYNTITSFETKEIKTKYSGKDLNIKYECSPDPNDYKLKFNETNGIISGLLNIANTYNFTISASNLEGKSSESIRISIRIRNVKCSKLEYSSSNYTFYEYESVVKIPSPESDTMIDYYEMLEESKLESYGLKFNKLTGEITGFCINRTRGEIFKIFGINEDGNCSTQITIMITIPPPPFYGYENNNVIIFKRTRESRSSNPILKFNNNTVNEIDGYRLNVTDDVLKEYNIIFNKSSGVFSGMSEKNGYMYIEVTAYNYAGDKMQNVILNITDPIPNSLNYSNALIDRKFYVGKSHSIEPLEYDRSILYFEIEPLEKLSEYELIFDKISGRISGNISSPFEFTTFTIFGCNNNPENVKLNYSLELIGKHPPPVYIEYNPNYLSVYINVTFTFDNPRVIGNYTSFEIDSLDKYENGNVKFDSKTGNFSGYYTVYYETPIVFIIYVMNDEGNASTSVSLQVLSPPPSSIEYNQSVYYCIQLLDCVIPKPTMGDLDKIDGYSTNDTISEYGLILNKVDGSINGIVNTKYLGFIYLNITAYNLAGLISTTITIKIIRNEHESVTPAPIPSIEPPTPPPENVIEEVNEMFNHETVSSFVNENPMILKRLVCNSNTTDYYEDLIRIEGKLPSIFSIDDEIMFMKYPIRKYIGVNLHLLKNDGFPELESKRLGNMKNITNLVLASTDKTNTPLRIMKYANNSNIFRLDISLYKQHNGNRRKYNNNKNRRKLHINDDDYKIIELFEIKECGIFGDLINVRMQNIYIRIYDTLEIKCNGTYGILANTIVNSTLKNIKIEFFNSNTRHMYVYSNYGDKFGILCGNAINSSFINVRIIGDSLTIKPQSNDKVVKEDMITSTMIGECDNCSIEFSFVELLSLRIVNEIEDDTKRIIFGGIFGLVNNGYNSMNVTFALVRKSLLITSSENKGMIIIFGGLVGLIKNETKVDIYSCWYKMVSSGISSNSKEMRFGGLIGYYEDIKNNKNNLKIEYSYVRFIISYRYISDIYIGLFFGFENENTTNPELMESLINKNNYGYSSYPFICNSDSYYIEPFAKPPSGRLLNEKDPGEPNQWPSFCTNNSTFYGDGIYHSCCYRNACNEKLKSFNYIYSTIAEFYTNYAPAETPEGLHDKSTLFLERRMFLTPYSRLSKRKVVTKNYKHSKAYLSMNTNADCPFNCRGNGKCLNGKCACYRGYDGGDCSLRTCPYGKVNGLNVYMECSNQGKCNRNSGMCECNAGFEGRDCSRMSCPNQCSNHGVCHEVKDVELVDGRIIPKFSRDYKKLDGQLVQICICDDEYEGYDCSLRKCPRGYYERSDDCESFSQDKQTIIFNITSNTPNLGEGLKVFLRYTDPFGMKWYTNEIRYNVLDDWKKELYTLPSGIISLEDIMLDEDYERTKIEIVYSKHQTGRQIPIEIIGKKEIKKHREVYNVDKITELLNTEIVKVESIMDNTLPATTCSDNGICNSKSGLCECFDGFEGNACDRTLNDF